MFWATENFVCFVVLVWFPLHLLLSALIGNLIVEGEKQLSYLLQEIVLKVFVVDWKAQMLSSGRNIFADTSVMIFSFLLYCVIVVRLYRLNDVLILLCDCLCASI